MPGTYRGPVRLVLFDVDGVLTDGILHINGDGECFKNFNAKDGVAIALLRTHGINCGIISGKASKSLDYRARELKFEVIVTDCNNKLIAYNDLKYKLGLTNEQIVFVGDDIIDLPTMKVAGVSYAPCDAHELVRNQASHITTSAGGHGVARDVAEHILQQGGLSLEESYQCLLNEWSRHEVKQ